jgi:hypothetical protein
MKTFRQTPQEADPALIQALAGLNAASEMQSAQTARRRVMGKLLTDREQKTQRRQNRGLAIMVSLGVLLLVSPAIWASVDSYIADGHFGDLYSQVTLLVMILFAALLAALIAGWRNRLEVPHGKRDS